MMASTREIVKWIASNKQVNPRMILMKMEKGMTQREKFELVQILTKLNRHAEEYGENITDADIIDFVVGIKTKQSRSSLGYSRLSVAKAADDLGVSKRRVQAMMRQLCPQCGGDGDECSRCRGTGMKLPAIRFGNNRNSPMMIFDWSLKIPDILGRKPGNPGNHNRMD